MGRSVFAQPATSRNRIAISAIVRERICTLPRPWLSRVLHHGLCAGSWPGSDRDPRPVRADPSYSSALSLSVHQCPQTSTIAQGHHGWVREDVRRALDDYDRMADVYANDADTDPIKVSY